MSSYQTVIWQQDDEITSTKLQQMSTNIDLVKSNTIYAPLIKYQLASTGAANGGRGRPVGTTATPTKMLATFTAFDSPDGTHSDYEVYVDLTAGNFTYPPISVVTVVTGNAPPNGVVCFISDDTNPTLLKVHVEYNDGRTTFFNGVINGIHIGY